MYWKRPAYVRRGDRMNRCEFIKFLGGAAAQRKLKSCPTIALKGLLGRFECGIRWPMSIAER